MSVCVFNACVLLQLTLRVKALKRQVDEGEAEAERLEGLKRKAIRDMEEMQEQKEALQSKVTALENKDILYRVMLTEACRGHCVSIKILECPDSSHL